MNIGERLFELRDLKYREFHRGLVPTAHEGYIVGVRMPQLRALIARYSKLGDNAFYKYYLPVDDTVTKALERL